jgi:hypothetical protein
MLTLLLVLSCLLMAGVAAAGLLLSAEEQRVEPAGPVSDDRGLSDLSLVDPR